MEISISRRDEWKKNRLVVVVIRSASGDIEIYIIANSCCRKEFVYLEEKKEIKFYYLWDLILVLLKFFSSINQKFEI